MSKKNYWHGYLEAGTKSTPVLRDLTIETGNESTIYLYSLKRNKVLEFQINIVEPKLRELGEDESDVISELTAGYKKAKKEFTPRGSLRMKQVELTPQPSDTAVTTAETDLDDLDDIDIDDDDIDIDMDDD
ncbi:MAG: hypothetical protein OQL10_08125 [Sedimenticola sp.]|uniref:Uncharacterized protein n=1 Tax=Sedimenticola thiotaurini TaxID=1543721 RepID=A0A558DES9_9GAMM|nr:hypothetical protein [Sedimenticola sp.]MCW8975670.1 hypothetical protein [Sedimenticola sp.]MDF1527909.1 hypothetical protein [Sedimenticola sp.]TVT59536.1 MAG: hypothetical protein FHK82_00710 [Sedimenticola thiotaurini]